MGIIEGGIVALLSTMGGWFGGFFGAYLKKKGENLATREDFRDLKEQTGELRRTTREIEAKIDDQIWNKQRRWELKRDVLFEASKRLANVDEALISLKTVYELMASTGERFEDGKLERLLKWQAADKALSESRFFVGVVCEKQTVDAIDGFAAIAGKIAADLNGDAQAYADKSLELARNYFRARAAIRRELEIDATTTYQSDGSSIAQAPDPSVPSVGS